MINKNSKLKCDPAKACDSVYSNEHTQSTMYLSSGDRVYAIHRSYDFGVPTIHEFIIVGRCPSKYCSGFSVYYVSSNKNPVIDHTCGIWLSKTITEALIVAKSFNKVTLDRLNDRKEKLDAKIKAFTEICNDSNNITVSTDYPYHDDGYYECSEESSSNVGLGVNSSGA